jgi:hypothetical protein
VGRHVTDRRGLAGRVRGMSRRTTEIPRRGVGMACCRAGLGPRDLASRPGAPELDRASWTVVARPGVLEMVQDVLRTVGRPDREEPVVVVPECSAATHGDEPPIADFGEDHDR